MEGVEDIPGSALHEGVKWNWETFPEFLNFLDSTPKVMDYGALLAQAPLRTYVMGKRGAHHVPDAAKRVEKARDGETYTDSIHDIISRADVDAMKEVVEEAVAAGAMGFSCSRSLAHRDIHGNPVPGSFAAKAELDAMALAVANAGGGVFQTTSDFSEHIDGDPDGDQEMRMLKEIAIRHPNVPVTFTLQENSQGRHHDNKYSEILGWLADAKAQGGDVCAQVTVKAVDFLMSLQARVNPLQWHPTFRSMKNTGADHAEQCRQLKDPNVVQKLITEHAEVMEKHSNKLPWRNGGRNTFPWSQDYEQDPDQHSIAAMAEIQGRHVVEVVVDLLLSNDGTGLLVTPVTSYSKGNLETTKSMLAHPQVVIGGSDGGAHVGFLQDAANCTFLLTHWARDRRRGSGNLPLEFVVKKQTSETARLFGMDDRGTLEVGMKADVNVINLEDLELFQPRMVYDLPLNTRRWIQESKGYDLTMCNGVVTFENGKATGSLPGRLVRNPRSAAARAKGGKAPDHALLATLRSQATTVNELSKL